MSSADAWREELWTAIGQMQAPDLPEIALAVFRYQYTHNLIYQQWVDLLGRKPQNVKQLEDIPFLPISLFKTQRIAAGDWAEEEVFSSSGTTGQQRSQHFVRELSRYEEQSVRCFEAQYGPLSDYRILALLPSYLERQGSSLIYMIEHFLKQAKRGSGFYLYNIEELRRQMQAAKAADEKVLLWGVSFALLDFAEAGGFPLGPQDILLETGGMKGRRKEILREELHAILGQAFGVEQIHSEYGMTELLSQAYSLGQGIFSPPAQMGIYIREHSDPLHIYREPQRNGAINIVDLANLDSCAFIATDDLGRKYADGRFEVLGRLDQSDLRGCNLLVEL
ncbi:acyl transferase [Saprospira grandis]|uniref:acyl transferase n=1 Tax=Saprospira grandis TaxID=1008 RepID=UPI0022DDFA06|nr:acyl transferase [Saprospira grandis]WBM74780.1 acyl transferase [Saprospira grandis]